MATTRTPNTALAVPDNDLNAMTPVTEISGASAIGYVPHKTPLGFQGFPFPSSQWPTQTANLPVPPANPWEAQLTGPPVANKHPSKQPQRQNPANLLIGHGVFRERHRFDDRVTMVDASFLGPDDATAKAKGTLVYGEKDTLQGDYIDPELVAKLGYTARPCPPDHGELKYFVDATVGFACPSLYCRLDTVTLRLKVTEGLKDQGGIGVLFSISTRLQEALVEKIGLQLRHPASGPASLQPNEFGEFNPPPKLHLLLVWTAYRHFSAS